MASSTTSPITLSTDTITPNHSSLPEVSSNAYSTDQESWAKRSKRDDAEEEIIKELCCCNGLTIGRLSQDGKSMDSLEMFFSGYPRICGLKYFPNLTMLTLIGQSIERIDGLSKLTKLTDLWLCECQISVIENLSDCLSLQKLYLYSNFIRHIENLEALSNLEVLWLGSNLIENIENLSMLTGLKELNLADNRIESIHQCLDSNKLLEDLNLSGNPISSLKEITNLIRLPRLASVSFKDPQYKACPVSLLCNYSTHILYHLPNLKRLDTYPLNNPLLFEHVDSTVKKKEILYKMRDKMIERDNVEMIHQATRLYDKLLHYPHERVTKLVYTIKSIEREIHESNHSSDVSAELKGIIHSSIQDDLDTSMDMDTTDIRISKADNIAGLNKKLAAIKERLNRWNSRITRIEQQFVECKRLMDEKCLVLSGRLVTEFESGGNICFEEATPNDPWYTCVHDLILSRFCASQYMQYCINGMRIERITKVTNRMLRMRYDARLLELTDPSEGEYYPGYKSSSQVKHQDYLLFHWQPELAGGTGELEKVMCEGFMDSLTYENLGTHGGVPLTNSLYLADQSRITHLVQANKSQLLDSTPFRQGMVLVARAYTGKSAPSQDNLPIKPSNYPKHMNVYKTRSCDAVATGKSECDRGCDCLTRQTEYFMFDHRLVLPEFIVEFEYITKVKPLSPFVHVNESISDYAGRRTLGHPEDDPNVDDDVLLMEPQLKKRARMVTTTEDLLMRMLNVSNLANVTELNLLGNGLTRVKYITSMLSLKRLILSFNELTRIDEISNVQSLEELDVSFNKITTLEGIKNLSRVKYLDLSWNQLHNTRDELSTLRKHVMNVQYLDTRHNQWQKIDSMRMRVIGRLRQLVTLDGTPVKDEVPLALRLASGARISQLSLLTHSRTDMESYRAFTLMSTAQTMTHFSGCQPQKMNDSDNVWYAKITTLNLDQSSVTKLSNLERLVNLRWATFNDNYLTRIEGLDTCEQLQELSFNNNCITQLSGLSRLTSLTHLHLSHNFITSLDYLGLHKLVNLTHLALDSNKLTSLGGVQKVLSLVELYVANNNIENLREVFYLKNLTSLVIADLYGNPVWKNEADYRMFVIYHLRSLKALDGIPILSTEGSQAKELFGGRLTGDFIAEKFGHSCFDDITKLDFPNSYIKSVEFGAGVRLINLHSVNLEQNGLTSLSGLIHLHNLRVLCLNCNRIECIVPDRASDGIGDDTGVIRSGVFNGHILRNLEVLHLAYNGITDLIQLQINKLTSLKALFLQGNEISKIEGIECLHSLRELVLDQNKIKSLSESSFANQRHLLELHLEDNRMRDLRHFNKATRLERLFLGSNRIQDVSEVENLAGLNELMEISLINNPVTRKLLYRTVAIFKLPKLVILDGQPVSEDDRYRANHYFYEQQVQQMQQSPAVTAQFDPTYNMFKPQTSVKVTNVQLPGASSWSPNQVNSDESVRKRGFGPTASPQAGYRAGVVYMNTSPSNATNVRSQYDTNLPDRSNAAARYNRR